MEIWQRRPSQQTQRLMGSVQVAVDVNDGEVNLRGDPLSEVPRAWLPPACRSDSASSSSRPAWRFSSMKPGAGRLEGKAFSLRCLPFPENSDRFASAAHLRAMPLLRPVLPVHLSTGARAGRMTSQDEFLARRGQGLHTAASRLSFRGSMSVKNGPAPPTTSSVDTARPQTLGSVIRYSLEIKALGYVVDFSHCPVGSHLEHNTSQSSFVLHP